MITTYNSSFLRAGSKFRGSQQSDKQKYNVEVDIKSVNMAESELCGYLRIEGIPIIGLCDVKPLLIDFLQV